MLAPNYQKLKEIISATIDPKRIITNPLQTLAYGTDASFYRLIPKIVILAHNETEVVEIMKQACALQIPVTYRAGGTSLSGQAISDSVLVLASHGWKDYKIFDNNKKITLQPGIVGAKANAYLAPLGLKIGPDPASIGAAMIGGIAANNASGMCCGTSQNSYKTVADMRLVFFDGTILDTADKDSISNFKNQHPSIIKEIEALRNEIKEDQNLYDRIKKKFKIKNTTGYSINALVDFEDPIEIIKHLMIGSEGTLAFTSNITFDTVIDEKYKSCTLMIFNTIEDACDATPLLKESPVAAVELLDRDSIRSVENDPDAPEYFKTFPESACVLLVEVQANDIKEMESKQAAVRKSVESIPTFTPYEFTMEPKQYNFNWKARKGLLPTVGGLRNTGTTVIIEDVAFPVAKLAAGCIALKKLFKKYEYNDAVLFGHALEGNLHLVFSQDFSCEKEVQRYANMMDELADIIVDDFDGSLKAEHGTGRNMSPFVEKEWGEKAYLMMKRIKKIFDPKGIINPGVIINSDPKSHLKNLKPLPAVHPLIDQCMECGFCEPHCVAEGLTLSPRQRIAVAREISRLKQSNDDPQRLAQMEKDAVYFLDETCATDGLCGLACPVKIDTGKFVKQWRSERISTGAHKKALYLANHFAGTTAKMRTGLNFVGFSQSILGNSLMGGIASGMRTVSGDKIPKWTANMPKGATEIKKTEVNPGAELKVVYFPSCINRAMGKSEKYDPKEVELRIKTEQLLTRAGYTIIYPEKVNDLCCGMAFSSKGYKEEGEMKSKELEAALTKASDNGKIPILYDMSPCFYTSKENFSPSLKIYDPIEFMLEHVMPKLEVKNKKAETVIFPVCSVKKIGMLDNMMKLSKLCAEKVTMVESNCCGFAGDRGFSFPELNTHGQRDLKKQIPAACKHGYSTSRTCEIGMEEHSGINFKSIFYLIDEVTKGR
ncbi:oxidoreductase [Bacteroidales bacterium]|nr:oxidoreductase [Bacteroidales bacterium]